MRAICLFLFILYVPQQPLHVDAEVVRGLPHVLALLGPVLFKLQAVHTAFEGGKRTNESVGLLVVVGGQFIANTVVKPKL